MCFNKDTLHFSKLDENMIRWVITVPAIWSYSSKQFMREAALKVCTGYLHNCCLLLWFHRRPFKILSVLYIKINLDNTECMYRLMFLNELFAGRADQESNLWLSLDCIGTRSCLVVRAKSGHWQYKRSQMYQKWNQIFGYRCGRYINPFCMSCIKVFNKYIQFEFCILPLIQNEGCRALIYLKHFDKW